MYPVFRFHKPIRSGTQEFRITKFSVIYIMETFLVRKYACGAGAEASHVNRLNSTHCSDKYMGTFRTLSILNNLLSKERNSCLCKHSNKKRSRTRISLLLKSKQQSAKQYATIWTLILGSECSLNNCY